MTSTPISDRVEKMLDDRRYGGLLRSVAPFSLSGDRIDCSTNSYLGLHDNIAVAEETVRLSGAQTGGNLASRLVATTSSLYSELEQEIAGWEQTASALVFTSGYAANLGIIQALCTRSTEVFGDRLNHASVYDGVQLSGCRFSRYRHCDMTDLARRLAASDTPEKLIITDTVFSMDGDRAPLQDIAELALRHHAMVMVDEAHATGIFGSNGSGLVEETGTADAVAVRMGTLSKAIAGLGGYVAASSRLRDYFVNFSRSLVYSTGLPHAVLAHNLAAIRHIRSHPGIGKTVLENAALLRTELATAGFDTAPSTTQIIPCYCKNERNAESLAAFLSDRGIIAPAIRPPTVPKGTARIRFSWSAQHTDDDRRHIVACLKEWKSSHA